MRVTVKLMATLRGKLPLEAKGIAHLDLDAGATLRLVLQRLGIGEGSVHVVMVNEELERDRDRALKDGDILVCIPPVAGG